MSENTNTTKRRSAIQIMGSLIGLVKPLLHIMLAAIILGTLGYLCAIFLTILAGQVIMHGLLTGVAGMIVPVDNMWLVLTPVKTIITVMIVIAVLRGSSNMILMRGIGTSSRVGTGCTPAWVTCSC